jgi:hypothetical protein
MVEAAMDHSVLKVRTDYISVLFFLVDAVDKRVVDDLGKVSERIAPYLRIVSIEIEYALFDPV